MTYSYSSNIMSVNRKAYLGKVMINPINPDVYVLGKKKRKKKGEQKSCHCSTVAVDSRVK